MSGMGPGSPDTVRRLEVLNHLGSGCESTQGSKLLTPENLHISRSSKDLAGRSFRTLGIWGRP